MSPERIYLRHYNDSQTSPIDPHTLRLWRLGDGDIEYIRADLASPTPSLADGAAPSGVVEAAMKVFGDFTYEALRHHKERSTKVKEFHAATNLIWDALRSLPQAPATPAAAPVEGHRVSLPYSTHRQVEGALVIAKYSDESGLVSRTLDLLREDAVYHPEAPTQGVEAPRERITYKPDLGLVGE